MSRIFITATLLALILQVNSADAQSYEYDFNSDCMEAYTRIFELRFNEARTILEVEKKEDPYNLIPVFLENYMDFLKSAQVKALIEDAGYGSCQ